MRAILVLALAVAATTAKPASDRIVGGSVTSIEKYPFAATLLFLNAGSFIHWCGGTVINNRSILSAAHCFCGRVPAQWRSRVGSTYASSGGIVYTTNALINHPQYDPWTTNNDVGIMRINGEFLFGNVVQPGSIAGPDYNLADNLSVLAIGWGRTGVGEPVSEQLRHVEVWTVNQSVCASRYAEIGRIITPNMLCSGWLDVGGRDQCGGDSGSPLLHNGVVVGVCSWGYGCAHPRYPGVNARVSSFTSWIDINA